MSDRLYWTDERYGRIISARNNGSEKLVIAVSSQPRAIVVHPCKGSVFIIFKVKANESFSILLIIDYYFGQTLVHTHRSVVQH